MAAANAINMYLERDVDGLMRRTRRRPLPEGRLAPFVALAFGAMLASAAIPLLLVGGGLLVAGLGLLAFYAYVWGYTPLKRRSRAGAVPGRDPRGAAAADGLGDRHRASWTRAALALFAILFVWQIPHFVAIAIFRAEDYARRASRCCRWRATPALTRRHRGGLQRGAGAGSLLLPVPLGAGRPALRRWPRCCLGLRRCIVRALRPAPGASARARGSPALGQVACSSIRWST